MEPLGTKIRRKRKELGLTLDELAGRTQVSKPYLSLIETGRVTPVIDRTYPLSAAAEAMRYLEAGHTQGKVVLTI